MALSTGELRLKLAALAARMRVEAAQAAASLAWVARSCSALAEEEADAVEAASVLGVAVPGSPGARRRMEAWARGNAALGLALEVETRQWCRRLDQARASQ